MQLAAYRLGHDDRTTPAHESKAISEIFRRNGAEDRYNRSQVYNSDASAQGLAQDLPARLESALGRFSADTSLSLGDPQVARGSVVLGFDALMKEGEELGRLSKVVLDQLKRGEFPIESMLQLLEQTKFLKDDDSLSEEESRRLRSMIDNLKQMHLRLRPETQLRLPRRISSK